MNRIVFELHSLIHFEFELKKYPELQSGNRIVTKGISILRGYFPRVLKYLSKQQVLSRINDYTVEVHLTRRARPKTIRNRFRIWVNKEKGKRLLMLIIEAMLIPFTGILALLPGPNFFFYVPALLFYYHYMSYRGMRRIDWDNLKIEIVAPPSKSRKKKSGKFKKKKKRQS